VVPHRTVTDDGADTAPLGEIGEVISADGFCRARLQRSGSAILSRLNPMKAEASPVSEPGHRQKQLFKSAGGKCVE
jgi:hypothetical protein